jgi:uncharacterized RDD family membrane protein YckC/type II secretory pathway pseudopilin PulG
LSTTPASPWNPPKARLAAEASDVPLYAGFWRRAAASFLDTMLVYAVTLTITVALSMAAPAFLAMGGGLPLLAVWWLYFAFMHSSERQATIGKLAFGIKVTDTNGDRIGFWRATGRYFATILSSLILMIGFLMAGFTDRKQALHDVVAGTLVVRASADPDEVPTGSGTMPLTAGVWIVGILLFGLVPVTGILAAIALPAYQDYTVRAKMTEAVAFGGAAKLAVQEFHAKNGKLPATLEEAGYVQLNSPYVAATRLAVAGPKVVVGVTPRGMPPGVGEGEVLFTADAANPVAWTCSSGGIKPKFLPAACRN